MNSIAANSPTRSTHLGITQIALLIWLFILTSFLSVRERDAAQLMSESGFDLQIKLQIAAWFALGFLALYLWARRRADVRLLIRAPLFWYCAYAAIALGSSIYSTSIELSLFRAGQLFVVLLLVISLGQHLHRLHLFIFAFLAANWVFVLTANLGLDFGQSWIRGPDNAFMMFGRGTSEPWRFASPIAHASQVSIVGAAGAVGLAMRTRRSDFADNVPIILFFVITVLLTVSRTAIATMLIGFVVVAIVRGRFIPLAIVAGVLIPMAMMFTPMGEKTINYAMRGQSVEEFQSLTGRSEIYRLGLARAMESMPLGEGFVAGRAKAIVAKEKGRSIVHSHNLFIESAVGMGILGIATALMVLLSFSRSLLLAVRLPPDRSGVSPGWEPMVMAIPIIGFCILDRGFASPVSPFVCVFIAVLALTTQLLLSKEETQPESQSQSQTAMGRGGS